eukprot:TRINITY_DN3391_c0_g1_i2.p1 TRINITY_DN3391_c0_g1~~TRINITY_DN3391_c0_g1_i2.p1  ORF type:complete len:360 (-),score=55.77 TRINITY_DN3391_c0_g1_i2:253-1332(-)
MLTRRNSINLSSTGTQRRRSFVEILRDFSPFDMGGSAPTNIQLSSVLKDTKKSSPIERCNHTATLVGNKMVIYGGRDLETNSYFGDIWTLDLDTFEWSKPEIRGEVPNARALHTANLAIDGKTIVIVGGADEKHQMDDILALDCETWTFETLFKGEGFPGGGLAGHTATLYNHTFLYIIGGRVTKDHRASADVYTFNLGSREFSKVDIKGSMIPRAGHSATLVKSKSHKDYIAVYGGKNGDSTVDEKFILLDIAGRSWNRLEFTGKAPGLPRMFHSTILIRSVILLFGGKREYAEAGLDSIYTFDTDRSHWGKITDRSRLSLNGRHGQSLVIYKDKIYVFGGCHARSCYNDVHEMTLTY